MANNYQGQIITELTQINKKPYNDCEVFALLPNRFISVNPGSKSKIVTFVKKLGEQFGNPIPYTLLEGEVIQLLCFDENNSLFLKETMVSTDSNLGEFQYQFQDFDLDNEGVFESEIVLGPTILAKFKLNVKGNYNIFDTVTLYSTGNTPELDNSVITLSGINFIISDTQYVSFKIVVSSEILAHFIISEINSIDIRDSEILIFTNSEFTKIIFPDNPTAQNGFNRIISIMNGSLIS